MREHPSPLIEIYDVCEHGRRLYVLGVWGAGSTTADHGQHLPFTVIIIVIIVVIVVVVIVFVIIVIIIINVVRASLTPSCTH